MPVKKHHRLQEGSSAAATFDLMRLVTAAIRPRPSRHQGERYLVHVQVFLVISISMRWGWTLLGTVRRGADQACFVLL
jgi:hypothetical protein